VAASTNTCGPLDMGDACVAPTTAPLVALPKASPANRPYDGAVGGAPEGESGETGRPLGALGFQSVAVASCRQRHEPELVPVTLEDF